MLDHTFKMIVAWTLMASPSYILSGGLADRKREWKSWKSKALLTLIICLALGLSLDYAASKQRSPADYLPYWLDPYPISHGAKYDPQVVIKAKKTWMYESPHSPNKVLIYYDDPTLRRDWSLIYSDSTSRSLTKGAWRMDISASKSHNGSSIMYTLRKAGL